MKFEEKENILTFPNIQTPIIYFLIDGENVVYVGQSKIGLSRPYQHMNKKFDKVSFFRCEENELDYLETKFIQKYKPKYNKAILNSYSYSLKRARKMIREQTFFKGFTLNDLKWIIRKLELETDVFDGVVYMRSDDFCKIVEFLEKNKEIISQKYFWKDYLD